MNTLIKSAQINPKTSCFQSAFAFFHSTAYLERGRRDQWNSRPNNGRNFRRFRNNNFRGSVKRGSNAYVDYFFQQSWESDFHPDEQPPNNGPSWFQSGSRKNKSNKKQQTRGRRGFSFCEDDAEAESIFRSAFGDRFFFWSFINDDYPNWRRSSQYSNGRKSSWRWRDQGDDEEYDYLPEDGTGKTNLTSERMALGLSASGPIKLEDVKNAYRTCALKWHPDRHQGSSKAAAEEKFKQCTAAYQSLCDSFAVN